jgi:hypothetical protein
LKTAVVPKLSSQITEEEPNRKFCLAPQKMYSFQFLAGTYLQLHSQPGGFDGTVWLIRLEGHIRDVLFAADATRLTALYKSQNSPFSHEIQLTSNDELVRLHNINAHQPVNRC